MQENFNNLSNINPGVNNIMISNKEEENKNVKESLLNLQRILASTKLGESLLNKTLLIE
jgi:hypothetical protein